MADVSFTYHQLFERIRELERLLPILIATSPRAAAENGNAAREFLTVQTTTTEPAVTARCLTCGERPTWVPTSGTVSRP